MGTSRECAGRGFARRLGTVAAVIFSLAAGTLQAQELGVVRPNFFGLGGVYVEPDSGRGANYGTGYFLSYAGRLGAKSWWEAKVQVSVLDTGSLTAIDYYQTGLGLDFLLPFGRENSSHLFGLLGGGVVLNDVKPDEKDGRSTHFDVGMGWRAKPWRDWGVRPRVDLRMVYDTFDSGQTDFRLGFGLEIHTRVERIVERIVEVEKIVEVPVEVEKIVEREIECVVPTGSVDVVAPAPAPTALDTDGDGVTDALDKCPQTLKGAKVDATGCVKEKQTVSLPNIEFEPGSTVLARGGKSNLETVVSFLQNQDEVRVDIFGHTDAQGADDYNQKLSEGRAASVLEYLASRGIEATRLTSKGFGESQPIDSNESADGRARNRRVELLLRTSE